MLHPRPRALGERSLNFEAPLSGHGNHAPAERIALNTFAYLTRNSLAAALQFQVVTMPSSLKEEHLVLRAHFSRFAAALLTLAPAAPSLRGIL